MKVHFAASNHNIGTHLENYEKIVTAIKDLGHSLVREWLKDDVAHQESKKEYTPEQYTQIWRDVKNSMLNSDAVVVEATENTYSIGYQTAFALSNKKPVLVLTRNRHISQTIISGEDNPLLTVAVYNDDSLSNIIENFLIKFNVNKQDLRFNMLLDRETQMYLELESYQSGKTKARIIRDMLKAQMSNKNGL